MIEFLRGARESISRMSGGRLFGGEVSQLNRMQDYAFSGDDILEDIESRYGFDGDLAQIYVQGSSQLVHKWHHYLPIYDRYFSKFRGEPVRFLEIGVAKGGSLSLWRKYLGQNAVIFGVDIDPDCARFDGIDGQVRIGSQDDPAFLSGVVAEMGGVDVILDDGSHTMEHIRATLEHLLPQVSQSGVYMIEDLHTAYWADYGGGYYSKDNFFNYVRSLVDDMHAWYHMEGQKHPDVSRCCASIHIHDSICVIDKGEMQRPTHSTVKR
jgi:hypothetical protein